MNIIVSGSIAYDYLMQFPGRFVEHIIPEELHQVSLSFLVEDMTRHWGGVAANIAFTMAKLGVQPKLMGTVGQDFMEYRQRLQANGVDTSTVRQHDEVFTASFFCNTDLDNNQIASFYSGAMSMAKDFSLAEADRDKPDLVIISPNDPEAMANLAAECRERDIRFIYDPSQQLARLSGDDIRRDMDGCYGLVVNGYEAGIIKDKTGLSIEAMREQIEVLVITHGEKGSVIYNRDQTINVAAFAPSVIQDPTGTGDAYRAGLVTGMIKGFPLQLAGEIGALCAAYVLEQVGTQNHSFTIREFIDRFRTRFDDRQMLDQLLS